MKIVAFLLSALLFSCTALSHPYRQVVRYAPQGHGRVVHNAAYQNVRVVAGHVVAGHAHHARVVVVYPLPRLAYRRVAVVTYRPHYNRAPRAVVYRRHALRHSAHCRH